MQRHTLIGISLIFIILVQVSLGIATGIMKQLSWSIPVTIFSLNTAHKYTGYALVCLAKIQAYLIMNVEHNYGMFWSLMIFDIGALVALVWRKKTFPTLSQTIVADYKNISLKPVLSLMELKKGKN